MTEQQKKITKILFWGAYGIFLLVSIPHIAWVFRQYTPLSLDNIIVSALYWLLAVGYAVAIDGVMAWLSHAQSQQKNWNRDAFFTWIFIAALVGMSWYLNWVYDLAHDPTGNGAGVWNHPLLWGYVPGFTIGSFTPTLLGALPVFTIAYVSVLNKVNSMKAQDAKSVAELEQEATETERRNAAIARIKNAGKKKVNDDEQMGITRLVNRAVRDGKLVGKTLISGTEKPDPHMVKLIAFFSDTPELLSDENKPKAIAIIKKELRQKDVNILGAWHLKLQKLVVKKAEIEVPNTPSLDAEIDTPEEEEEEFQALTRADLDSVEAAMYDHLIADNTTLLELRNEAISLPISDLVSSLQSRFSTYANYINETRVRRIWDVITATFPDENENEIESEIDPNTDPNQEAISTSNPSHLADEINEVLRKNSPPKSTEMPANVTEISAAKSRTFQKSNQATKASGNRSIRGPYAITKSAAAKLLKCSIAEIDRGISDNEIEVYSRDAEKVLRSSVLDFIPQKQARKTTKLEAK